MSEKMMNRAVAFGVFLAALVVYIKTLSVTVVFWDVGEFCAASRLLQVPHPPGSPLFVLIARLASLVPYMPDIAARMHAISAVGSAFAIMFLYLVCVKIISRFQPIETSIDRWIVYGSSVIGSLALAFSATFWDNSIEAEVYGLGMFFASCCLWLALVWWDRADEKYNERYLFMIAYLLGLSTGVHILALLVTIPILMIYYFRKYEYTPKGFLKFGVVAVAIFFVIYPGIVQFIPSMLDGNVKLPAIGLIPEQGKSDLLSFVPALVVIVVAYYAFTSYRSQKKMLHIATMCFLLIVVGYSTYTQVIIRSNVPNLPMKENDPDNLDRLTSYLTREQYGDTPLLKGESWNNDLQDYEEKYFPRRYSREAMHEPSRVNYSSDADFFWRYQVDHMYTRYVLQNFCGAEGDWQDARADLYPFNGFLNYFAKTFFGREPYGGEAKDSTFCIPLLIGLLGIYWQFRKDWKMGLVFLAMFTIMGIVLDLYQNQQDPQPRERDYFYVGAYYAFSLWIAVGVVAIINYLREGLKQTPSFNAATAVVLAICFFAVPVRLANINWHEHDRHELYIAWDYSYNLLQSCEPDALLFTNGDNDTFPLWYLQDVEGIRTDVRIVNLSLVNTSWYIHLLKNETPHGTKKIALTYTNDQIERLQPILWTARQIDIPVPKDVAARFGVTDSLTLAQGKISFMMNGVNLGTQKALRVQDIMVRDIIMNNHWERPIYFAVTCSPDSKIGLDNYLWMRGLAYRLKPQRVPTNEGAIADLEEPIMEKNVLGENVTPSKTFQSGYLYRNLNNPNVYYDENVQRMIMNYRASFMRLAFYTMRNDSNNVKARKIMDRMEELIPIDVIPNQDWRLTADIMSIFNQIGDKPLFDKYSKIVESTCNDLIASPGRVDPNDPDVPYRYLLEVYTLRQDYASALTLMKSLELKYPTDQGIKNQIKDLETRVKGAPAKDTVAQKH